MRMWPYQMLDVLPTKQLVSQWRECLAIAGSMASEAGLNHATVNRVKEYPVEHFAAYCDLVRKEFEARGFTIGTNTIEKLDRDINYSCLKYGLEVVDGLALVDGERLLGDFHGDRYVMQCVYSFQERYDCGTITKLEWERIYLKLWPDGVDKW